MFRASRTRTEPAERDAGREEVLDAQPEQVQGDEPDAYAPQKGHRQPEVQVPPVPLRVRVHAATVLSSLIVVQLAWLVTLAYGAYLLLR
jgi:hypothetical protein